MEYYTLAAKTQKYSDNTKVQPVSYKNGDVYNSEHVFKLEKNLGKIKNQFIEVTVNITTDVAPIVAIKPFGSSIFQLFSLNSSSGPLQSYSNYLLESRIALLKDTPLGNKINAGQIDEFVEDATQDYRIRLPLMWFFTDLETEFFTNTKNSNEEYFLYLLSNKNKESMGLGTGIISVNSISVKLITNSIKLPVEEMQINKTLKSGYNSFNEQSVDLVLGDSTASLPLSCLYKTFATHFIIKGNDGTSEYKINKIVIKGPKGYYREITDKTNYSLWNNNNFYSEDLTTSFSVFFGSRNDGYDTENYICYDPQTTPYTVELEFDTIFTASGAVLHCVSEYHTKFVTENGMIYSRG